MDKNIETRHATTLAWAVGCWLAATMLAVASLGAWASRGCAPKIDAPMSFDSAARSAAESLDLPGL